ncbi:hypothetical protein HaLaN_27520, partial [Haematococcus lacustris]
MPAQASADTPQLLTIDCSSDSVGGPCDVSTLRQKREMCVSLASHTGKGTLTLYLACCELTT